MTRDEWQACISETPPRFLTLLHSEVGELWEPKRAWCALPAGHPALQDPDPGEDE